MHDPIKGVCWGYGNYKVSPNQVCDSYSPEQAERAGLKEIEVTDELWSDDEWRAAMSSAEINDLPDEAFAYIEPGGEKDGEGKTTPRSLRHFPVHDAPHTRNALARASQSPFGDKAMPKILAAAKKFGIQTSQKNSARSKKPRRSASPQIGVEVRHFTASDLELRDSGSNLVEITGTPIVYDAPYKVHDAFGEFTETMKPGVVSKLLEKGTDTRFLFNHQGLPLARTTAGTLNLEDTPKGLSFRAQLDTRQSLAADLAIAIERRDITQMSVGMVVAEDEWADNESRTIHRLKALEDVSAVTYPASPTTNISVVQRMVAEMPVESRARVRRLWAITRELKEGREVDSEDLEFLSSGIGLFVNADTLSSDDKRDLEALIEERIGKAIGKKTAGWLKGIHDQIRAVLIKNGHDPDAPVPAAPPGELAGPQGDLNAPVPDPAQAKDATGTRSSDSVRLELELLEIRRTKK